MNQDISKSINIPKFKSNFSITKIPSLRCICLKSKKRYSKSIFFKSLSKSFLPNYTWLFLLNFHFFKINQNFVFLKLDAIHSNRKTKMIILLSLETLWNNIIFWYAQYIPKLSKISKQNTANFLTCMRYLVSEKWIFYRTQAQTQNPNKVTTYKMLNIYFCFTLNK